MSLEKSEQDGPLSFQSNLAFVFALRFYLRIYLLIKKVSQHVKAKMLGQPIALQENACILAGDVEKYRRIAYKEFYSRPCYVLKTVLGMWNYKEAMRIIRSARSIIERIAYYKET